MSSKNHSHTQKIRFIGKDYNNDVQNVLVKVHAALKQKGYNPVEQIVGYILSGDPTYITAHEGARSLIGQFERDELLEEVLHFYMEKKK